jgi:hypothetical protein
VRGTLACWRYCPGIRRQARVAFRKLGAEERDEAMTEVIANVACAYHRLVEFGKEELAYAIPLARLLIT